MDSVKGFTLLEMILVILILSIIIAMSSTLLTQGLNSFANSESIMSANWQGQIAMQRIVRDIMAVRSPSDITTATASNFSFTNTNNESISYSLSGNNLNLTLNGNSAILADSIQNLTFSYFDKSGSATATTSLIRLVRVSFNVVQNNVSYTLTTAIFPRNLA